MFGSTSLELGRVVLCSRCPMRLSSTASLITQAGHSRCTLPLTPIVWAVCTSCCSWALIVAGTSVGGTYPQANQLWGLAVTTVKNQLCKGPPHRAGLNFCGALVPDESDPWVCCLWTLEGGASVWPEAVHWACWLWGFLGGTGQGQLPPESCPSCMSYKVICRWLVLVLGLEVPRRCKAMNQVQLLLMLGVGPLSERYRAYQDQMLLVWEIVGWFEA